MPHGNYAFLAMSENKPTAQLPEVTFSTFVISLGSSALVHLGEVPDPNTEKLRPDKVLAKNSIDLLNMLQAKTKGNLDDKERQLLESLLFDLKMKYVKNFAGKN